MQTFLEGERWHHRSNQANTEMIGAHRPARTVIDVKELPKPGFLVFMNPSRP